MSKSGAHSEDESDLDETPKEHRELPKSPPKKLKIEEMFLSPDKSELDTECKRVCGRVVKKPEEAVLTTVLGKTEWMIGANDSDSGAASIGLRDRRVGPVNFQPGEIVYYRRPGTNELYNGGYISGDKGFEDESTGKVYQRIVFQQFPRCSPDATFNKLAYSATYICTDWITLANSEPRSEQMEVDLEHKFENQWTMTNLNKRTRGKSVIQVKGDWYIVMAVDNDEFAVWADRCDEKGNRLFEVGHSSLWYVEDLDLKKRSAIKEMDKIVAEKIGLEEDIARIAQASATAANTQKLRAEIEKKSPSIAKILAQEQDALNSAPIESVQQAFQTQQASAFAGPIMRGDRVKRGLNSAFVAPEMEHSKTPRRTQSGGAASNSSRDRNTARKRGISETNSGSKSGNSNKKAKPAETVVKIGDLSNINEELDDVVTEPEPQTEEDLQITVPDDLDTAAAIEEKREYMLGNYKGKRIVIKSALYELCLKDEAYDWMSKKCADLQTALDAAQEKLTEKETEEAYLTNIKNMVAGILASFTDSEKALFENVRNLSEFQINQHHLLAKNQALAICFEHAMNVDINVKKDPQHKTVFIDMPESERLFGEDMVKESVEDTRTCQFVSTVNAGGLKKLTESVPKKRKIDYLETSWDRDMGSPAEQSNLTDKPQLSPKVSDAKVKKAAQTAKLESLAKDRKRSHKKSSASVKSAANTKLDAKWKEMLTIMKKSSTPLKLFVSQPSAQFFKYRLSEGAAEGIMELIKLWKSTHKEAKNRKIDEQRLLSPEGLWSAFKWYKERWFRAEFVNFRVLQAGETIGQSIMDGLALQAVCWVTWRDPAFDWKTTLGKKGKYTTFLKNIQLAMNENPQILDTTYINDYLEEKIPVVTIPKPMRKKSTQAGQLSTSSPAIGALRISGSKAKGSKRSQRRDEIVDPDWNKNVAPSEQGKYKDMYAPLQVDIDRALGAGVKKQDKSLHLVAILAKFLKLVVEHKLTGKLEVGALSFIDTKVCSWQVEDGKLPVKMETREAVLLATKEKQEKEETFSNLSEDKINEAAEMDEKELMEMLDKEDSEGEVDESDSSSGAEDGELEDSM